MAREDFSYESSRLRALADFARTIIVPAAVLMSFVNVTNVQFGYYTVPCCGFCILLGSYLQGAYRSFQLGRDAKRLGKGREGPVGSIPVQVPLLRRCFFQRLTEALHSVKGKLPGGIDLIIRAIANNQKGYIHDLFLEWFEECQSTTINVRVLGIDKVGISLFYMCIPLTTTCSSSQWTPNISSFCW